MKFMVLIYNDGTLLEGLPEGEADEMMRGCLTHADELRSAGILLESQMLEGPETARSIRVRNGRTVSLDGPFAEAKEVLGGFNIIEADSMEDAMRIAQGFPWARTGCVEVRPVRDIESVRRRVFPATACLAAALVLGGCQDVLTACEQSGRAGVVIEVIDAATGIPLGDGLRGVATDDAYSETLIDTETGLMGLHERPGKYAIRIERDGYMPWDSAGVDVRQSGACHVATTPLTVRLERTE